MAEWAAISSGVGWSPGVSRRLARSRMSHTASRAPTKLTPAPRAKMVLRPVRKPWFADRVGASTDEQRSPDGSPHGDSDLAEGVVDAARHAALRLGDDADRHVRNRGVEQADAGAGDEEPSEQRRPLGSRF